MAKAMMIITKADLKISREKIVQNFSVFQNIV